jgi:menaquinone-9 beta-reductase
LINRTKQITIIGGGLAGLIASIRLARRGLNCTLIEKRHYPFHRVCGEYISNETVPFLTRENLLPAEILLPVFNRFQLSSVNGKSREIDLDLGGFGISRYTFDHWLYQLACREGVTVLTETEVDEVNFSAEENHFVIKTGSTTHLSDWVIGSFGKRSKLDKSLDRSFLKKRSPYVGVKYHIRYDHPDNLIALHNFDGGYCGMSNIENGKTNLCYLVHRDQIKRFKNIDELEEKILSKNPLLQKIFAEGEFLFDKPETINEIAFETKEPVWGHVLMAGDSAGMIAPLCGNGMAMAIHSGKLVSDLLIASVNETVNREQVENRYRQQWNQLFAGRLRTGRLIQNHLFGSEWSSRLAVSLAIYARPLTHFIIRKTHGTAF